MATKNPYMKDSLLYDWWDWGYRTEKGEGKSFRAPVETARFIKAWDEGIEAAIKDRSVLDGLTDAEAADYIQEVARDAETVDLTADIGDINSTAKGSGARYTTGKAKVEYIPMRVLVDLHFPQNSEAQDFLSDIGEKIARFEEGDDDAATEALDLLFERGYLSATCAQFDFGAKKYAEWNWAKGMPWSVPLACIKRHWLALAGGEENDPESGVSHWGAIGCNLVMLVHFVRHYPEGDDRPPAALFNKGEAR